MLAHPRVQRELYGAPPELQGYVAGVVAVLRVDPNAVTQAFETRLDDSVTTVLLAGGRGFLTYVVSARRPVVVLLDLVWVG